SDGQQQERPARGAAPVVQPVHETLLSQRGTVPVPRPRSAESGDEGTVVVKGRRFRSPGRDGRVSRRPRPQRHAYHMRSAENWIIPAIRRERAARKWARFSSSRPLPLLIIAGSEASSNGEVPPHPDRGGIMNNALASCGKFLRCCCAAALLLGAGPARGQDTPQEKKKESRPQEE